MGKAYLIDTNIISKSFTGEVSEIGAAFLNRIPLDSLCISFINHIKLLSWQPKQEILRNDISRFLSLIKEIPLSEGIIQQTITVRQQSRIKLPDALIAATVIAHDLILIADNDRDFGKIPRLRYINP